MIGVTVSAVLLVACVIVALTIYAERSGQIVAGNDPSFFYRVVGPRAHRLRFDGALPDRRCRADGRGVHRARHPRVFMKSSLYSIDWRFRQGARRPHQLLLASLDLSRPRLGPGDDRGADLVSPHLGGTQHRFLLAGKGHVRAGVGRLCVAKDVAGLFAGRRPSHHEPPPADPPPVPPVRPIAPAFSDRAPLRGTAR